MFRFTIRDVLWLTVVVACLAAWWIDHRQQSAKNYQAEMLNWQFRAESLRSYVERKSQGKVSFSEGQWERRVLIEDGTGAYNYLSPLFDRVISGTIQESGPSYPPPQPVEP